ncbi:hypothetical protein IFM89_028956, partial [Coptis chinensis]
DKNVVIFGLPGAFTGVCLSQHVPSYKNNIDKFKAKGVDSVCYLSSIRHRNLVNLLGYYQENGQQMLIYEYIPNGSISSHLYGQVSNEKLQFKNRLSIALGAAKGLAHLRAITPILVHKNFKTTNVLVDENFIAKVADVGLRNLTVPWDWINAPGEYALALRHFVLSWALVKEFGRFSNRSDVYSFGVFLLELVCGREALQSKSSESDRSLVEWVIKLLIQCSYMFLKD